jgi:hypothetical protein
MWNTLWHASEYFVGEYRQALVHGKVAYEACEDLPVQTQSGQILRAEGEVVHGRHGARYGGIRAGIVEAKPASVNTRVSSRHSSDTDADADFGAGKRQRRRKREGQRELRFYAKEDVEIELGRSNLETVIPVAGVRRLKLQ